MFEVMKITTFNKDDNKGAPVDDKPKFKQYEF